MPLTEEGIEAANKRKAEVLAKEPSSNKHASSPQQGQTANAGTQQAGVSTASAANASEAPLASTAIAPAAAANAVAVEPTFLLDDEQFAQILVVKNDTLRASAKAMKYDMDTKAIMV